MRIINIVDTLAPINIGVWQSAASTGQLLAGMGVVSELWYPAGTCTQVPAQVRVKTRALEVTNLAMLKQMIGEAALDPARDIIVTHGCWQFATRWGAWLKQKGFKWVYVPHGMLEPWPLQHKKWKKKLYLKLVEGKLANKADIIRAVSQPEQVNLVKLFPSKKVVLIPNGVNCAATYKVTKPSTIRHFVFMARLHKKKGAAHLVEAWLRSSLNGQPGFQLTIAGPDEGEWPVIEPLVRDSTNISYVGPIQPADRDAFLANAHYYVLPSYSEGFPTSVLEAMEKGCVPLITQECNFNECIAAGLGVEVSRDIVSLAASLEDAAHWPDQALARRGEGCYRFIRDGYSLEHIAMDQLAVYKTLLLHYE